MRGILLMMMVLMVGLMLPCIAVGAEPSATQPAAIEQGGIGEALWTFLNSPVGITVISSAVAWILAKLWTAKPAWRRYVDLYGPYLVQGVKLAEKAIPDDTPNKSLQRLNHAMAYALRMIAVDQNLPVASVKESELAKAITATHAQLEADGNLAKKAIDLAATQVLPPMH
jgi:hypothetical protein